MKNKIIVCNWKMNGSCKFINSYYEKLSQIKLSKNIELVILPPFPYLSFFNQFNIIRYGSQDVSQYNVGPYTGDVSADILKDVGCSFSLIGHSERKLYYNENTNIFIKKISMLIKNNINPIVCCGETHLDKKNNNVENVLSNQIMSIINSFSINQLKNITIAYEPIWSIGTGLIPSFQDIEKHHNYIKMFLKSKSQELYNIVRVIYGGSVNATNFFDILNLKNVDGVLIGSFSLDIDNFFNILKLY